MLADPFRALRTSVWLSVAGSVAMLGGWMNLTTYFPNLHIYWTVLLRSIMGGIIPITLLNKPNDMCVGMYKYFLA